MIGFISGTFSQSLESIQLRIDKAISRRKMLICRAMIGPSERLTKMKNQARAGFDKLLRAMCHGACTRQNVQEPKPAHDVDMPRWWVSCQKEWCLMCPMTGQHTRWRGRHAGRPHAPAGRHQLERPRRADDHFRRSVVPAAASDPVECSLFCSTECFASTTKLLLR